MIKIYVYTAYNGYSWFGCDEGTAGELQRYLDATGTFPRGHDQTAPYGGAVRCVIGNESGTAVYRYLVRPHGDAFGRDSLYVPFAFIPTSDGHVDFAKLLESKEMAEPRAGEPEMLMVDASRFPLPTGPFSGAAVGSGWWTQSKAFTLSGHDAMSEASKLFFMKESHLGLLRAVFPNASTAKIDYSVYKQVEEYERCRDAAGRNPNPKQSIADLDAALDALSRRAAALSGFDGLEMYAKDAKGFGGKCAARERTKEEVLSEVLQAKSCAASFRACCTDWGSRPEPVDAKVLQEALDKVASAESKVAAAGICDADVSAAICGARAIIQEKLSQVSMFNDNVVQALNGNVSELREAMLRLLMSRAFTPGDSFEGICSWAREEFDKSYGKISQSGQNKSGGLSFFDMLLAFLAGCVLTFVAMQYLAPGYNAPKRAGEARAVKQNAEPKGGKNLGSGSVNPVSALTNDAVSKAEAEQQTAVANEEAAVLPTEQQTVVTNDAAAVLSTGQGAVVTNVTDVLESNEPASPAAPQRENVNEKLVQTPSTNSNASAASPQGEARDGGDGKAIPDGGDKKAQDGAEI